MSFKQELKEAFTVAVTRPGKYWTTASLCLALGVGIEIHLPMNTDYQAYQACKTDKSLCVAPQAAYDAYKGKLKADAGAAFLGLAGGFGLLAAGLERRARKQKIQAVPAPRG